MRCSRENQWLRTLQEFDADRLLASNDASFQQSLLFPHLCVRLDVFQVRWNCRDELAGSSPRSQTYVDAIEEPFGHGILHGLDKTLSQWKDFGGLSIGEEHQIDVGTVVQFFATQLAESDHSETVGIDVKFFRRECQAGLNQTVGEQRQLHSCRTKIDQTKQVAGADSKNFESLKSSQRIQRSDSADGAGSGFHGRIKKLFAAFQIGKLPVLNQHSQTVWIT